MPSRGLLASVVIGALLAMASVTTASAAVDRPVLTPGDFWTYRTNSTLLPGLYLVGEVTSQVMGQERMTVEGVTMDAYRIQVTGTGDASGQLRSTFMNGSIRGSWRVTGQELLEPSELKVVSTVLDLSVNGTFQGVIPFSARVQNTTTFRILEDAWRFPLEVGRTGHVTVLFNYTEDRYGFGETGNRTTGSGIWVLNYTMEARTDVSVWARTFDAYRIREDWPGGGYSLLFFAPSVGNNVRTESYNDTGSLTATTELVAYRYQVVSPPTFLGLPSWQWGLAAGGIAAVALLAWSRRRSRKRSQQIPSFEEARPPSP